jgi:hypothetical protein
VVPSSTTTPATSSMIQSASLTRSTSVTGRG